MYFTIHTVLSSKTKLVKIWDSSINKNKQYFMIDQQISRYFVHYTVCLSSVFPFYATREILILFNVPLVYNLFYENLYMVWKLECTMKMRKLRTLTQRMRNPRTQTQRMRTRKRSTPKISMRTRGNWVQSYKGGW